MKKILFLTITKESMTYSKDVNNPDVKLSTIFKNRNKFIKILVRLSLLLDINLTSFFFYEEWLELLPYLSNVIIIAHPDAINVVKYLNKKFPYLRINIWYNNPVLKEVSPEYFRKMNCKIWTFDREDSMRYNLNYKNQYLNLNTINSNIKNNTKKYDIIFIGKNKNRLNILLEIENIAKSQGLTSLIHVVSSKGDNLERYTFKPAITYEKLIEMESESDAIIDIVQEGQSGITLRTLEALFLNKKIITNNKSIKKENFYHPNNILIVDDKNMDEIGMFLKKPLFIVDDKIKNQYSFDEWIVSYSNETKF